LYSALLFLYDPWPIVILRLPNNHELKAAGRHVADRIFEGLAAIEEISLFNEAVCLL
jgi:hypothetical protein